MNYISLGYFCSVALELEKMGLRNESSPFDWVISDFSGVMSCIQNHFLDFLSYEHLAQNANKRAYYQNTLYNIQFFHDFDKYKTLERQLPTIQEQYNRRIARFYHTITEPTLFIRYISDEEKINGVSKELLWIEENFDAILTTLKSFNSQNNILFIANDGVESSKLLIYNVPKDSDDVVSRLPLSSHPTLSNFFQTLDFPNKEKNLIRYKKKKKKEKCNRLKQKLVSFFQKLFLKEYQHFYQYH